MTYSINWISAWMVFLFTLPAMSSETVYRDQKGMPRCVELADKSIFIFWDALVEKEARPVFALTLKEYSKHNQHQVRHCKDWQTMNSWPAGLQLVSQYENEFSPPLRFAIDQVKAGGTVFRAEKSAASFISNYRFLFRPGLPVDFEGLSVSYGNSFAEALKKTWITSLVQNGKIKPGQCDRLIGRCEYYLCVEAGQECGLEGYAMKFGYKYCSLSLTGLYQKMQTPLGRSWVVDTVQCLQKKTEQGLRTAPQTCQQIEEQAVKDHPGCYVDSGFCAVPFSEKLHLWSILKTEIFRRESFTEGGELMRLCRLRKQEQ